MEAQRSYGQIGTAAGNAPKSISQLQGHADHLSNMATQLAALNNRIEQLLDRVGGPVPQNPNAKDEAQPVGVLTVAQFEARRIGSGLDRLTEAVSRLEQIA